MNSHQASGKEKHFGHLLQAGEKWEEGLRPLFLPLPSLFTKIKAILSSGCSGVQRVPSPALGSSKLLNPLQHCWDVFCPELEATEAQPCEMASAGLSLRIHSLLRWEYRIPGGAQDSVAGDLVVLLCSSVPKLSRFSLGERGLNMQT